MMVHMQKSHLFSFLAQNKEHLKEANKGTSSVYGFRQKILHKVVIKIVNDDSECLKPLSSAVGKNW